MSQIKYKEGFLIVATCHAFYKNSALALIDSLDEHYPDCKIMVATVPEWEEEFRQYPQVVEVRTDGPDERRTKLWALRHTVFEKTCYLDADMEVNHEDIKNVWDLLDDKNDCVFTLIYGPNGASTAIYNNMPIRMNDYPTTEEDFKNNLSYHGGFFVWWNNDKHPLAVKAMEMWWDKWEEINKNQTWWDNHPEFNDVNRGWDQFTWWWIMNNELPDLKVGIVEGEPCPKMVRWNWNHFINGFADRNLDGGLTPIIIHRVIKRETMHSLSSMATRDDKQAG